MTGKVPILKKYLDLADVFSKELGMEPPERLDIN